MIYSYMRCSTNEDRQTFDRQIEIIKHEHRIETDKDFCEYISGGTRCDDRAEFKKLLTVLKKGDIVYCAEMSRLSRSLQDLIETVNTLVKDKGIKLIFLKENLVIGGEDGMSAISQLIFNIMGCISEFEKALISERVKDALKAKKANGVELGRPERLDKKTLRRVIKENYGKLSTEELEKTTGACRATLYKLIRKMIEEGEIKPLRECSK